MKNNIIGWVGGKRQLRSKIISFFPKTFNMYVEVFGGAAWVMFAKDNHAKEEVYNDYNNNLVNLFRCVKHHPLELERELKNMLPSRENFNNFKKLLASKGLTDIQRAAIFFYIINLSFGSRGTSYATRGKGLKNHIDRLGLASERLHRVVIENKDFEELIKLYDRKDTFFYLDPPYYGTEAYYDWEDLPLFTPEDHIRLNDILKNVKGKFLLSYNDSDFIRELYKDFEVHKITRKETLSSSGNNQSIYREILIKNY